jgi:antitoxin component of MazEF toxin-antitoxin module
MIVEVTTKPKKWGNSLGVIIPKEIIDKENITIEDEVIMNIEKKKNKEKADLMKKGYIEMSDGLKKLNREWSKADSKWP